METQRSALAAALDDACAPLGVTLTTAHRHAFCTHFDLVLEANRTMNLTRITDPVEAAVKHYADSLAPLAWFEAHGTKPGTLLDVGTGAGFPAIPLAVLLPRWSVTALDSTHKKIAFVARSAEAIGLTNLSAVHERSEHFRPAKRYGVVMCRATAPLPVAIAKTAHLVRPGGWFVLFRTAAASDADRCPGTLGPIAQLLERSGLEPVEPFAYTLRHGGDVLRRELWIARRIK